MDPHSQTILWFLFGISLLASMVITAALTDVPLIMAALFGGLGALVSLNSIAHAFNRTIFEISERTLVIKTRPIPFRPSRSIRCAKIASIRSFHGTKTMRTKGVVTQIPYTTISAAIIGGPPIVLMKVDGYRADIDYIANVLMQSIGKYRREAPSIHV